MTRPTDDARETLLSHLESLFRGEGFAGVSIGDISRATGLGRSSLYHYFPGGKDDMALAVAERSDRRWRAGVIAPLLAAEPLASRVKAMLAGVDAAFEQGRAPCLMAAMNNDAAPAPVRQLLARLLADWIAAIATALVENGAGSQAAQRAAHAAVERIEGALMVARSLGDRAMFRAALDDVASALVGAK